MAINLKTSSVQSREQRLGTIIGWDGKASELARDSAYAYGDCETRCGKKARRLCEQSSPFSQGGSGCSEAIAACTAASVQEAVLIQHSPIGCATLQVGFNSFNRHLRALHGLPLENARMICTNLREDDMVFGGEGKLEQSIRDAWQRYHPKAIFLTSSCATGIIGDDIESVASKLQGELGIPVVSLRCEGFRSKHWSAGWDVVQHGILRQIVRKQPVEKQEDLVNVINLWGEDVFTPMFAELGLRANLIVTGSTVEELSRSSEAAATVSSCYALSYMATALEEEFGVPEIKAPLPYGLVGTDAWIRELARVTHREAEAEVYIAKERLRIAPQLERYRNLLAGKKGYVSAGAAFAHGLMSVFRELGIELEGAFSYHHDPVYDSLDPRQDSLVHLVENYGDIPNFTVSNSQHYQLYAALQRVRPDFTIIRHGGLAVLASRLGIPAIPLFDEHYVLGYQGILNLGEAIVNILPQRKFYNDVAAHTRLPYKPFWLKQTDPFALNHAAVDAEREVANVYA